MSALRAEGWPAVVVGEWEAEAAVAGAVVAKVAVVEWEAECPK